MRASDKISIGQLKPSRMANQQHGQLKRNHARILHSITQNPMLWSIVGVLTFLPTVSLGMGMEAKIQSFHLRQHAYGRSIRRRLVDPSNGSKSVNNKSTDVEMEEYKPSCGRWIKGHVTGETYESVKGEEFLKADEENRLPTGYNRTEKQQNSIDNTTAGFMGLGLLGGTGVCISFGEWTKIWSAGDIVNFANPEDMMNWLPGLVGLACITVMLVLYCHFLTHGGCGRTDTNPNPSSATGICLLGAKPGLAVAFTTITAGTITSLSTSGLIAATENGGWIAVVVGMSVLWLYMMYKFCAGSGGLWQGLKSFGRFVRCRTC